ncbi:hypothetical protein INR49_027338 [Caranx melampygus]|nr:hypothetical protein INR49_027338 [Caranx melampygus]
MSDLTQPPASGPSAPTPPPPSTSAAPAQDSSSAGTDSLSPELFTGIVQGVLSTMMSSLGAQQGNGESIAQFIQRLSQTSNLFTPGSGDAVGFFGDLLSLVCQSFSMVDMATVTVREGVDIVQTNLSFLRQQFTHMASHILRCSDHTFGPRLLLLCTRGLFECLALNLYCLGGEQRALTAVINHRIRRMSAEVNPSLVNWLTGMMSLRLHVILEHNPVTEDQIQHYVIYTQMEESLSPAAATTAEEAMATSAESGERGAAPGDSTISSGDTHQCSTGAPTGREEAAAPEVEPWAAAVPPTTQCEGPHLSLSDAVSRAARTAGVLPVTAPNSLQGELERPELQEEYTKQVKSDIKERVQDDPDYSSQRFPNTHRAFSIEDS